MSDREYQEAIAAIVGAWEIPGANPQYHREQQERLAREWPTLNNAVRRLVALSKERNDD